MKEDGVMAHDVSTELLGVVSRLDVSLGRIAETVSRDLGRGLVHPSQRRVASGRATLQGQGGDTERETYMGNSTSNGLEA